MRKILVAIQVEVPDGAELPFDKEGMAEGIAGWSEEVEGMDAPVRMSMIAYVDPANPELSYNPDTFSAHVTQSADSCNSPNCS